MPINTWFRKEDGYAKSDYSFDETLFLLITGIRAMTGDLDLANHKIRNLPLPINEDEPTTKLYMANWAWQQTVQYNINYTKGSAPIGVAAANNERCLDTVNIMLYTFFAGVWGAGIAPAPNDRFIFKNDGVDASGDSGANIHNDRIYQYNVPVIDSYIPQAFWVASITDEARQYAFNPMVGWEDINLPHNDLAGLQGGIPGEYYHLPQAWYDAIGGATTPSSTNLFQTELDLDRIPVPFTFAYDNFLANMTNIELYESRGIFQRILTHKNFSLVGITLQSTASRTAGTMTAEPTIDGVKVVPGDLDLTLNEVTINDAKAAVDPNTAGLIGVAGQKIGCMVTTVGWTPIPTTIQITIFVIFN